MCRDLLEASLIVLVARALGGLVDAFAELLEHEATEERRRKCQDAGPFVCAEEGCPEPVLSCEALATGEMCALAFKAIWTTPPPGTERQRVQDFCPKACGQCS